MQTLKDAPSLAAADAAQQLRASPQLPLHVQQLNAHHRHHLNHRSFYHWHYFLLFSTF
jgi:hypothetical protein